MGLASDLVSWVFLSLGTFFCLVGGIGLLRMPDFYCRTHAAGITDTLGAGLILTGLIPQAGLSLVSIKLVTVLVFLWLTSPTSTHALTKAAYWGGVRIRGDSNGGDDAIPD